MSEINQDLLKLEVFPCEDTLALLLANNLTIGALNLTWEPESFILNKLILKLNFSYPTIFSQS